MNNSHATPDNWWQHERSCRQCSQWFTTHLMALFIAAAKDGANGHVLYSGFLYQHNGVPLWITAGHVLNEVKAVLTDPAYKIIRCEWLDAQNYRAKQGIPVEWDDLDSFRIDERGIDLGVIILSEYHLRLIVAGKEKQFLTNDAWRNLGHASPDGYYLVGFPVEKHQDTATETADGKQHHILKAPTYCLPVEIIDDATEEAPDGFWGHSDAVYGRLLPFCNSGANPVGSIRFMSGGPLLSVERTPDNRVKYYLRGIQSSWIESRRIIRATGIEIAGRFIDELFRQLRQKGDEGRLE